MNRTIGDIMERDAYTCRYDQDLGEVVALFNELGTSGLVVIDEDRHVVGFISDGDIMKRSPRRRRAPSSAAVTPTWCCTTTSPSRRRPARSSIATSWSWPCRRCCAPRPTQTVGEIADVLAKKKFKKLPVVDDEGKLVGVIRRSAITKYIFGILFQ